MKDYLNVVLDLVILNALSFKQNDSFLSLALTDRKNEEQLLITRKEKKFVSTTGNTRKAEKITADIDRKREVKYWSMYKDHDVQQYLVKSRLK